MFDLKQFPEIILHVKSVSKICKPNTSGWIECFCPYCDDSTRKLNPQSGHFHLSPTFPFAHCFRCGIKVSLEKYLIDTKFSNSKVINELKKFPLFTFSSRSNIINFSSHINIKDIIYNQNIIFMEKYPDQFKQFKMYIYSRCLDINHVDYLLAPNIKSGILQIHFFNNSGELSTIRNLSGKIRYYLINNKKYYFFQDISKIDSFEYITMCEGAFDLINLFNYNPLFKNSFFISIGGINYQNLVSDIISNFLLIGEYIINIVFDKNIYNISQRIKTIVNRSNILNPDIKFNFYTPVISKDVSEFMLLRKL